MATQLRHELIVFPFTQNRETESMRKMLLASTCTEVPAYVRTKCRFFSIDVLAGSQADSPSRHLDALEFYTTGNCKF